VTTSKTISAESVKVATFGSTGSQFEVNIRFLVAESKDLDFRLEK